MRSSHLMPLRGSPASRRSQEAHERAARGRRRRARRRARSSSAGAPSNSSAPVGRARAARSAWRWASLTLWVEKTHRSCPRAASAATNSHRRSRWPGSSDAEGSSSASTGGSAISPSATFTRWRLPPESRPTRLVGALAEARLLEHPRDRRARDRRPAPGARTARGSRHRQLRVERRLLRRPADLAPARRGSTRAARSARWTAGDDRQQRRLAGAVGADHRDQLARAQPRS